MKLFRDMILPTTPLVLIKFDINKRPRNGKYIDLAGRRAGIFSWLPTMMRLDNETAFSLSRNEVYYKTASLFGENTVFFPLSSIASTSCGYRRPFVLIFMAVLVLISGLSSSIRFALPIFFFVSAIISILLLILYFLNKTIVLSVESSGGTSAVVAFKKSIIEGVGIDIDKARLAIAYINQLIVASQKTNRIEAKKSSSPASSTKKD